MDKEWDLLCVVKVYNFVAQSQCAFCMAEAGDSMCSQRLASSLKRRFGRKFKLLTNSKGGTFT